MLMRFYADLHVHSKYSRATSRNCDLENLTYWGSKKGINVIGTGDFTHPAWIKEIKDKLVPAEAGLFKLRKDIEESVKGKLPKSCQITTRFMLSVEISTIYKKGDKVRKIHHLVYAPTIENAEKINQALEKIGNIRSDGRPILGLDSRHLLEIVLNAGEDCFLVPAHIWTPWFAVLGSKSGFDSVAECYGDLAGHVFAVETGLSSDPEMNWKVSSLDRYRLMSNSDAHSPAKLGREACAFNTEMDYYSLKKALETGNGFEGTVEFFPEEGKYHMDGHRKCNIRFEPEESKRHNGICPVCKKALTLGVMYRVEELADRHDHVKPEGASHYQNLIPLPEVLSEIADSGPDSQKVVQEYEGILSKLGSELEILSKIPVPEIQKASNSILAEAISRMRQGQVIREAGYDGEYGVIKLFKEGELQNKNSVGVLFDVPGKNTEKQPESNPVIVKKAHKTLAKTEEEIMQITSAETKTLFGNLDKEQRKAVEFNDGPLMIMAGPGSGKTKTLTYRIAYQIKHLGMRPDSSLAITFTKRAANEMKTRLRYLLPEVWQQIPITTFHGLAHQILSENRVDAGLSRGFRIASEPERTGLLCERLQINERQARNFLQEIRKFKQALGQEQPKPEVFEAVTILEQAREKEGWLDYDDLIILALHLLEEDAEIRERYQNRFAHISVDEYQDIDELQYRMLRQLVSEKNNICVIGDPDQSIYSFRGAKVEIFLKFLQDFPSAGKIELVNNYRSAKSIVSASLQMIYPDSLIQERQMEALLEDPGKVHIHEAKTDKAEAEFVVASIEKMMGGISFFSIDTERSEGEVEKPYSFSDFAVLYRTESQANRIEEALIRSGIPYEKFSHKALYENPLTEKMLNQIKKLGDLKLSDAIEQAANILELDEHNPILKRLVSLAVSAGDNREAFLSSIYLENDADLWDPRADRVSLMTIHGAKGLEFSVVFTVGCEVGLLPFKVGPVISEAELAEERRLFFVAMTRAKDKLFLSHARKRMVNGKVYENERSFFIGDIEEKLIERLDSEKLSFRKRQALAQKQLF